MSSAAATAVAAAPAERPAVVKTELNRSVIKTYLMLFDDHGIYLEILVLFHIVLLYEGDVSLLIFDALEFLYSG